MSDEVSFIDFYAALSIPRDATEAQIEDALEAYQTEMRQQVLNPLTMKSARHALNVIIPGIRQALLRGETTRKQYDQQLAEFERQQTQERGEWVDSQALDEKLRRPFFFDPYKSYDTEQPAYTLREIAARFDTEWVRARSWLVDTSRGRHPLVLYLKHVALRNILAEHIEEHIIQQMRPGTKTLLNANVAIERCITLLNPEVERPGVIIDTSNPTFDSRTWTLHAGKFLPDEVAQGTLTLRHSGQRGCAFGRVVSLTDWLTLLQNKSQIHFALLPEGVDPAVGSVINLPLAFNISALKHKETHVAELVVYTDNLDMPVEQHVKVMLTVLALPPRVVFEPSATGSKPLKMRPTRRGVVAKATITPRNFGDEAHIPLLGHINSQSPEVHVSPRTFHANEPITITVETDNIQNGATYNIELSVDYNATSGAKGPSSLYIQSEVLPTFWQSMLREKQMEGRLINALAGAVLGFFILGFLGATIVGQLLTLWSLAIPIVLLFTLFPVFKKITIHRKRIGEIDTNSANVPYYLLWGGALGGGALLDLICALIAKQDADLLFSGIVGALIGAIAGFFIDKANSTVQKDADEL